MFISFDPAKNAWNIRERGLDFRLVTELEWETAWIAQDERFDYGERRLIAFAKLGVRLHVVCFTESDVGIRVISFRKANRREIEAYEQKTTH